MRPARETDERGDALDGLVAAAGIGEQPPRLELGWAELAVLAEGAALASGRIWQKRS